MTYCAIYGSSPVPYNLFLTADVKQRKQNILNNKPNLDNSSQNKENESILLHRG